MDCKCMNDLYFSPVFAPSEGTMAADDLDKVMLEVWDEEFSINVWLRTFGKEIEGRGLTTLPLRKEFKPLPKAKRAETVGVAGKVLGIIYELEH